jgi:hypothetical protein
MSLSFVLEGPRELQSMCRALSARRLIAEGQWLAAAAAVNPDAIQLLRHSEAVMRLTRVARGRRPRGRERRRGGRLNAFSIGTGLLLMMKVRPSAATQVCYHRREVGRLHRLRDVHLIAGGERALRVVRAGICGERNRRSPPPLVSREGAGHAVGR